MSTPSLVDRLLDRLHLVRNLLGQEPLAADADTRFADALDSMGFVEFLALVAEDFGVSVEVVEQVAGRRFGSLGELAAVLAFSLPDGAGERSAGEALPRLSTLDGRETEPCKQDLPRQSQGTRTRRGVWLAAKTAHLPTNRQQALRD